MTTSFKLSQHCRCLGSITIVNVFKLISCKHVCFNALNWLEYIIENWKLPYAISVKRMRMNSTYRKKENEPITAVQNKSNSRY